MLCFLRSLLAIVSLLVMSLVAVRANSASLPGDNAQWQSPDAESAAPPCRRPCVRHLVPGPQAGTHLQAQPFAYGYFGAHAPTTAVFHRNARGDWYQWSFYRAD